MKLLLIDDHAVVREGLRRLFTVHFKAAVSEAETVDEALTAFKNAQPDAVILDLNLNGAGGLEFLRRVLSYHPKANIIVFSMHHEPVYAVRALRAGARGYVTKSAPVDELLKGVAAVAAGDTYVDSALASKVASLDAPSADPLDALSLREIEIVRLLGQGKSMTAIADDLGIAYKTVANTCTQIKSKLGVERTADLIRLSVEAL